MKRSIAMLVVATALALLSGSSIPVSPVALSEEPQEPEAQATPILQQSDEMQLVLEQVQTVSDLFPGDWSTD